MYESVILQIIIECKTFRALISFHPGKILQGREGRYYYLHFIYMETEAQGGKYLHNPGVTCAEGHRQTGALLRKGLESWGSVLWGTGRTAWAGSPH